MTTENQGPDVMIIYEDVLGRHVTSGYSTVYEEPHLEVHFCGQRGKLARCANSLREIANELEAHYSKFESQRAERTKRVSEVTDTLVSTLLAAHLNTQDNERVRRAFEAACDSRPLY